MKFRLPIVLIALLASSSMASDEPPELLICDGQVFSVFWSFPFDEAFAVTNRPNIKGHQMTRGYVGIWMVRDKALFLLGVKGSIDQDRVDLRSLFPMSWTNGMVKADWFTGILILNHGRNNLSFPPQDDRFSHGYEGRRILDFKNGMLVRDFVLTPESEETVSVGDDKPHLVKWKDMDPYIHRFLPRWMR